MPAKAGFSRYHGSAHGGLSPLTIDSEAYPMGDVIYACFIPQPNDGGKSRIKRRREALALDAAYIMNSLDVFYFADDLSMDHADPGEPTPAQ